MLGQGVTANKMFLFLIFSHVFRRSLSGETRDPEGIKPRSLRFTWSMKTTSAMDPNDMMKEIRKVGIIYMIT